MRLNLALLGLIAGFILGPTLAADPTAAERGGELLMPFKKDLKAALIAGMADSPTGAISVCRLEAPRIAERLSVDGVRVGRSSHRLRNPDNRSPAWAAPLLEAYVSSPDARAPVAVDLDGDRVGYVEPILVAPLCLACHGEAIAPEVQAQIDALYPDDEAVGFRTGDFRGIFWAEFPAAP